MKILINVGEYDATDGVRQTLEWTKEIDLGDEREDFDSQARSVYKWLDPLQDDAWQYGGYFRQSENFTLITVPKAGHMVALTMCQASGMFISDLLTYGKLRCPTNEECVTFAEDTCAFMNDCSNHGSCSSSTGQCECDTGFLGTDCSIEPIILTSTTSESFSTSLTKW